MAIIRAYCRPVRPGDLSYPDWQVGFLNWIMSIAAASNPLLNVDDVADLANRAPHPLWNFNLAGGADERRKFILR